MVVLYHSNSAMMSSDPHTQSLPPHSALSLRPLAIQAMQKVDDPSVRQEYKYQRESSISHDFSDTSCYTGSDAASTAPSSPRTPRRKSELPELNIYALPFDTVHYKSSPPPQMFPSSGLKGPQLISSEQQSTSLPGPAQLFSSSGQKPWSPHGTDPQHDERKLNSTNVSVAEPGCHTISDSSLSQYIDTVAAGALSKLQLGDMLHTKPRHHVYSRGLNRRTPGLSSMAMEHQPPRYHRKDNYNSNAIEFGRCHVLRHVISYGVRKERYPPPPPPPSAGICKRKQKKQSHCNKPYTWEQTCWIRYQFEDLKKSWVVIEELFEPMFQDPDYNRTKPGLQGSLYRQNKMLPRLDEETERLVGMSNGHVAIEAVLKRKQKNRREGFFSLVNLFPEWAVVYPWVAEEHKQEAARLLDQRKRDREVFKQRAIDSGLYVENLGNDECACCAPLKWLAKDKFHRRPRSITPGCQRSL